jgi:hypothetical protein
VYALSIQQPWLDMILRREKRLELRNWEMRSGVTIALHAAKKIDFGAAYLFGYEEPWRLPRREVLGVATVSEVVPLTRQLWDQFLEHHRQPMPWRYGTYGLFLEEVRRLREPIAYLWGKPKIFPLSPAITLQIERQLLEPFT